jgi:ABC-2 type transport system ATP-binding protein
MDFAIRATSLSKKYPKAFANAFALRDLTLQIPFGGIYGLIGRNGAGKTTFIRIAATQLMPSSGTIDVLGLDVRTQPSLIRRRIAAIPQEARPLYFMTVRELVFLYLRLRGMERVEAQHRTKSVLDELSLDTYAKVLVNRLSGGMRRRAMVAMVLASDAEILFLDEPTTGLDPVARREVWGAIRRASRDGRTVLLTTHYLDEAEALSARLALLEAGELKLEGTPEELRARVRLPIRLTLDRTMERDELASFGKVSEVQNGYLVFAREADARELARKALERGAHVAMAPVSLEDIFLSVVGRSIDEEAPLESAA